MNFIKTIGRNYKGKDLFLQRKAEYSMALLVILFVTTFLLTMIKLILADITSIELMITVVNLAVFIGIFLIIYIGMLTTGVTLLTFLGVARLVTLYFTYDVTHMYLFIPLIMIMVSFMATNKFQYYFVNIAAVGMSIYSVIEEVIAYYFDNTSLEKPILSFVSFFYIMAILFILNRFIKVVQREIEASKKLFDLTSRDDLTSSFNRRKIDRTFKTNVFSSRISVLLIDFDDFKKINDKYGHQLGDEVLTTSVELIKTIIRKDDYVVRWGGEEFIVILHECDLQEGYNIAESIRKQLSEYRFPEHNNLIVTASIGVAQKDTEESIYETINNADKALYKAKASGKNQVHKF